MCSHLDDIVQEIKAERALIRELLILRAAFIAAIKEILRRIKECKLFLALSLQAIKREMATKRVPRVRWGYLKGAKEAARILAWHARNLAK